MQRRSLLHRFPKLSRRHHAHATRSGALASVTSAIARRTRRGPHLPGRWQQRPAEPPAAPVEPPPPDLPTPQAAPTAPPPAATLDWDDLPDLGGTSLSTPIINGPFQLVPEEWTGAVELGEVHVPPGLTSPLYPNAGIETIDLAAVRGFRYWRDPACSPVGGSKAPTAGATMSRPTSTVRTTRVPMGTLTSGAARITRSVSAGPRRRADARAGSR